jgi:hypothetical protein
MSAEDRAKMFTPEEMEFWLEWPKMFMGAE